MSDKGSVKVEEKDNTTTDSKEVEAGAEDGVFYPCILFTRVWNATPEQVKEALKDFGNAIVSIRRERFTGKTTGTTFICLEDSSKDDALLKKGGFSITFTDEQIKEQRALIKKRIEAKQEQCRKEGKAIPTSYDDSRVTPKEQYFTIEIADPVKPKAG